MTNLRKRASNFVLDLYGQPCRLAPFINKIVRKDGEATYLVCENGAGKTPDNIGFRVYNLVPDYLETTFHNQDKLTIRRFRQDIGYAVRISEVKDLNNYLKDCFKSNARNIKRFMARLEAAFEVRYVLYHGNIEDGTYNMLMDSLYHMICRRFAERHEKSVSLDNWEFTRAHTIQAIREQNASLFVIYANDKPIEISINFHRARTLFSIISCYDIDYSKFGLGHIEIYKQVGWCMENEYDYFEMGWGEMDYKRRWSNMPYTFDKLFVYPKTHLGYQLLGWVNSCKMRMKIFLISLNVHKAVKGIKRWMYGLRYGSSEDINFTTAIEPGSHFEPEQTTMITDWEEQLPFLKRPVYDYLYSQQVHSRDIKIYQAEEPDCYLVCGGNDRLKICTVSNKGSYKYQSATKTTRE